MAERKQPQPEPKRFAPHEGVNEVVIAVGGELLSVDEKGLETADPLEIRALEQHPQIKAMTAGKPAAREEK